MKTEFESPSEAPGIIRITSERSRVPLSASASPLKAWTDSGTSEIACSRFCAVTTISSLVVLASCASLHDFHSVATKLAQNPFLISRQQRRLAEFWLPYVFRAVPLDLYIGDYVANYQRIADALYAGDGVSAESAFLYHAAWSAAIIRGEKLVPGGPWSPEPADIFADAIVVRTPRK